MSDRDPKRRQGDGVSRRAFLKGGAAALGSGGLVGEALASSADSAAGERVGPGAVPVRLRVNGREHRLELEPRVTLLDALRDHLGLTGSKKVCDRATCGACTVLEDGQPVYACSRLAIAAQGAEITTVEGLGTPEEMHPLQAAFVEHDAQQCGFCTPGFVVATEALLRSHGEPTEAQLAEGLGGNLCRCGTYAGIRQVIAGAARGGG